MLTIFKKNKGADSLNAPTFLTHPAAQLFIGILVAIISFALFSSFQLIVLIEEITPIYQAVIYTAMTILLFVLFYWLYNNLQWENEIAKPVTIAKGVKISIYMAILILFLQMFIGMIQMFVLGDQAQVSANQSSIETLVNNDRTYYLMIAMILIGAPLSEEFVFRRALIGKIPTVKTKMFYFRVFLSVVSFALIHLVMELNGGLTVEELFPLAIYLAISAVVTYVYVKTGSLWYSILTHFLNNAIGILAMLSAS